MFTLEQIEKLHSKVKSWADSPQYIKDLKNIGIILYEVFVNDWHSQYFWENGFKLISKANYENLEIHFLLDKENFVKSLKNHQNGWSDYMTFCMEASQFWIAKWIMDLQDLTCSYMDFVWNVVLVEKVPYVD